MTETSRPRAASSAAATKPSPPLLPRPATTMIGPSSTRPIAASATACPALIISAKPGVPAAIVSRSARSISVVVKTSMPNPRSVSLFWRHIDIAPAALPASPAHELICLPILQA
jgi:hypothetical protein